MEARKQDQRPVPRTYYYLDYKEFVDVVKWKMYKMQTIVRDNLRRVNTACALLMKKMRNSIREGIREQGIHLPYLS